MSQGSRPPALAAASGNTARSQRAAICRLRKCNAGGAPANKPVAAKADMLDISARRYYRGHRGGNAAAAAVFAGVVGTIGAIALERERRRAYREQYYYGGYGNPYGGYGYGYGPRYYRY